MALCAALGVAKPVSLKVKNDLNIDRNAEIAEVDMGKIKPNLDGAFRVIAPDGSEVPHQITADGHLIFPATVKAKSTAVYKLQPGQPSPMVARTFAKFYPEHKDNFNWENDKAAYTAYGPALQESGERGFGYDLWTKNVDTLVLDHRYALARKRKSLHKDWGNGMDAYIVANTLGGGTAALLDDNGDIIFPWCWMKYEIIDNGPLRSKFRLTYRPVKIGNDEGVVETRVITLDAGSCLNKTEVSYSGLSKARRVVNGIVVHDSNREMNFGNPDYPVMAYVDLTDKPNNNNGKIYVGAVMPEADADKLYFKDIKEPARDAVGHMLAERTLKPGDTYTYYWGSAWSKNPTAPADVNGWMKYLSDYYDCVKSPLKVSVN